MKSVANSSTATPEFQPAFSLTCFNSQSPARLSKRFTLKNGELRTEGGGNMTSGTADRLTLTLADFAALLPTLKPSQATCYGIAAAGYDAARIVVADAVLAAPPGDRPTIARTRDHFTWPVGAGILMLDYDAPKDDAPLLDRQQLRDALAMACVALDTAPAVWRPSASSCIHVKGGAELRGIRGQRLYLPVMDASDIERAGKVLFDRLWLAGYGRYEFSGSGAWLARSPIDASVFQPERLDFCGGAAVGTGLEQRLPTPVIFNSDAPYLDTRAALPDLDTAEQARLVELREAAKTPELVAEQATIKEAWIGKRVSEHLATLPEPARAAARPTLEATYRQAVEGGRLAPDFELTVWREGSKTSEKITVGKVLARKDLYSSATCLDPLEPEYNGSRQVGFLVVGHKPPYISSRAHGGIRYELTEPAAAAAEPELPPWWDEAPPIDDDPGRPIPAAEREPEPVSRQAAPSSKPLIATLTAAELWAKKFQPMNWLVDGVLPEGVTLLCSPPKVGKTRLATQLAIAMAAGGYALNNPDTRAQRCGVLLLALESGDRRAQKDLMQLAESPPEGLHIATQWPRLNEGGSAELERWLDAHPDVRVVIIDTLAKVRDRGHGGKGFMYSADYDCNAQIKTMADARSISVVLIHHTNKIRTDAGDLLDAVSGSTGVTGSVDHILMIKRDRLQADGLLTLITRDFEDRAWAMRFESGLWTLVGTPDEAAADGDWRGDGNSDARHQILALLRKEPLSPREIIEQTGNRNARKLLMKLVDAGKVSRRFDGKYSIVTDTGNSGNSGNTGNSGNSGNSHTKSKGVASGNEVATVLQKQSNSQRAENTSEHGNHAVAVATVATVATTGNGNGNGNGNGGTGNDGNGGNAGTGGTGGTAGTGGTTTAPAPQYSTLSGDAALLAPVLALYRGAENERLLAQRMGWNVTRLVGAVGILATAGYAEYRSGMIKPAGRLVATP